MVYPGNYGFIPRTRSKDGDPVDVLVLDSEALIPSCLIEARPIGVLLTEDQDGKDSKIVAVAIADEEFQDNQTISDLSVSKRKEIEHFFEHQEHCCSDQELP
jgi:inorganic pyrophosphatase